MGEVASNKGATASPPTREMRPQGAARRKVRGDERTASQTDAVSPHCRGFPASAGRRYTARWSAVHPGVAARPLPRAKPATFHRLTRTASSRELRPPGKSATPGTPSSGMAPRSRGASMSREALPLVAPDLSAFARSLGQALKTRPAAEPPGHVELLNLIARAAGHRNVQALRAATERPLPVAPLAAEDRPVLPLTANARKALMQFDSRGRLVRWPHKFSVQRLAMWVLWTLFDDGQRLRRPRHAAPRTRQPPPAGAQERLQRVLEAAGAPRRRGAGAGGGLARQPAAPVTAARARGRRSDAPAPRCRRASGRGPLPAGRGRSRRRTGARAGHSPSGTRSG